jgi:hypothetical protein
MARSSAHLVEFENGCPKIAVFNPLYLAPATQTRAACLMGAFLGEPWPCFPGLF